MIYLVVGWHASLDGSLQQLLLRHHLLAVAVGALVSVQHALAAALVARLLHLNREARRHLLVHSAHTAAGAVGALCRLAILGARASALGADAVAVDPVVQACLEESMR